MRASNERTRRERGAALVEMALVLPFLMLLVVGIWATARAWNVHNTMDHAVREAARYGATVDPWGGSSPNDVRGIADIELSASAIDPADIQTVCIEKVDDGNGSCDGEISNTTGTDQIYVKLRYPNYSIDFIFFSLTVDLDAAAVARWEG